MAEHTEGPWEAIPEEGGENFAHSIYGEGYKGLLIARCNQNGAHDADAYLIAAAPDLLAVVKDWLEENGTFEDWHGRAVAAVAKAEGRSNGS